MSRGRLRLGALGLLLAGCTVHPAGEAEERARADAAGQAWERPFAERTAPPLRPDAPLADFVAHAERQNGALEAAWQRWRAALEQVPQDGTQPTTAMVGLEHTLDGGRALDRTALSLMSDAMNNLMLPGRLEARATAALARARAAAAEFDQVRLAVQRDVAEAYYQLAWHDEDYVAMLRERSLLANLEDAVRARVTSGTAPTTALLQLQIAIDRLDAERERMHADRPALVAAVRRTVAAEATLADVLPTLPELEPVRDSERTFLERALAGNPELERRRREHQAALAEQEARAWLRVPELSLRSALMGDGTAALGGAVSLPFLRSTAIDGAIAQAVAEARAAEALRRQAGHDAVAAVLGGMAELRGHELEAAVLHDRLLPRLRQLADAARSEWSAGAGDFAMVTDIEAQALEVERALLGIRREHAVTRARLAEATGALLGAPR